MTSRIFSVFAMTVLLVSCSKKADVKDSARPSGMRADSILQPDEYAVYSAVLDSLYAAPFERIGRATSAVVIDSTIPLSRTMSLKELRSYFLDVRDTVRHFELDTLCMCFNRMNLREVALGRGRMKSPLAVWFVPSSVLDSICGGIIASVQDWGPFYKRYPHSHGMVRFSRVAFNDAGDQAAVYWEWGFGFLAGGGEFLFLEKRGEKWHIVAESGAWIS